LKSRALHRIAFVIAERKAQPGSRAHHHVAAVRGEFAVAQHRYADVLKLALIEQRIISGDPGTASPPGFEVA
jgi:hypothetical protein